MTPPNVLGAAKPTSSVIISKMFGAPFGGTIRAGQAGFDCRALSSTSPLNGWGGAGRYLPSTVVVEAGEPGVPVVCCAELVATATRSKRLARLTLARRFLRIAVECIGMPFLVRKAACGIRPGVGGQE